MTACLAQDLEEFLVVKVGLQCANLRAMITELQPLLVPGQPDEAQLASDRVCDMLIALERSADSLSKELFPTHNDWCGQDSAVTPGINAALRRLAG